MTLTIKSKQIKRLYDVCNKDHDKKAVNQRSVCYKKAENLYQGESNAKKEAYGFEYLLNEKQVQIHSYDLFAGHIQHLDFTESIPIDMEHNFDPSRRPDNKFDILREEQAYLKHFPEDASKDTREKFDYYYWATECGMSKRWASGHLIAGYKKIMECGFDKLKKQIQFSMSRYAESPKQKDYLDAMLITVDAAQKYILRYRDAALATMKKVHDDVYIRNLKRIADACENLSCNPATSFFEAVQFVILLHELFTTSTMSGSMSLGRIDQLLYPYYEEDLKNNIITDQEAEEFIDALWLKLAGLIYGFQNVTLGGADVNGIPGYNRLTYLGLRASRKLRKDQPLISLRYCQNMPDEIWDESLELVKQGGGFPAFFNDSVIVPSKVALGVPVQEAVDYGIVGCVEPHIAGKEYSETEELRLNWAKILDLILHDGVCPVTKHRFVLSSRKDLDSIKSFDEFYQWYLDELDFAIRQNIEVTNKLDKNFSHEYPNPFLSCSIDDCVDKGADLTDTGPEYRFSTINCCGMADTVDSLIVIKKAVYEEAIMPLSKLARILSDDFTGEELLRRKLLNKYPKFGNDTGEPEQLMKALVEHFAKTVGKEKNWCGNPYQIGLYTVEDHANLGEFTGALPSGRKQGMSLANGMSPCQGMDKEGPTAVANAVNSFSHICASNGLVMDLKFTPTFLEHGNHLEMLKKMIEIYFADGGMEVQFNVVDRDTLIDAKLHPERHQDLVVRVSGFSAYFVMLSSTLQDEIIERTEYENF